MCSSKYNKYPTGEKDRELQRFKYSLCHQITGLSIERPDVTMNHLVAFILVHTRILEVLVDVTHELVVALRYGYETRSKELFEVHILDKFRDGIR